MKDVKEIIAENLIRLRQQAGLTQLQLAEKLNYSDKAVSKWERGESIPDLRVLIQLADIYHISLDDIVREQTEKVVRPRLNLFKRHVLITLLSVGLVWVLATGAYMIVFYTQASRYAYLSYVVAPFVSAIVLTVFSALWYSRLVLAASASAIVWSIVLIVNLFILAFMKETALWPFYVVAGGVQALIIAWFILRKIQRPNREKK